MKQEDSYHGMASAMLLGLLVICLITLLIDFLLRQVFKDKLVLFLTELVIAIVIPFLIYNAYFS